MNPPTDSGLTGEEARQTIPNGSVTELRSRLTAITALPGNLPQTTNVSVGLRDLTQFPDEMVADTIAVIDASGIPDWASERINVRKKKPGRKARVHVRALVVAMLLSALDHQGSLVTSIRDVLYHRISPAMQDELGITPLAPSTVTTINTRRDWGAYMATRRSLARLLSVLDPTVHAKGRKRTWDELDATKRTLTDDEQKELLSSLDAFATMLVTACLSKLPKGVYEAWDGSACLDGTPIKAWARGRAKSDTHASTDPDAGYYSREGDHGEDAQPRKQKNYFAYEAHALVASDTTDPSRLYFPSLAMGVALGRPGVDAAGNARRVLAAHAVAGHKVGYLTGDGLYTGQKPHNYQDEARRLGWNLILAFPDQHLGVKVIFKHVIGVEGTLYCPSLPPALINATKDYRAGHIDKATYDKRIAARVAYEMRPHDKRGTSTRYACPAAGPCSQVQCPLKADSMTRRPTKNIGNGQRIDNRPTVSPAADLDTHNPPAVCTQQTVTIPDVEFARYQQTIRYGTPEYDHRYGCLRNSQEGYHGFVKDDAKEALANPGKRRIGGLAAQQVFVALAFLAGNLRKIETFLRHAIPDKSGRLYVERPQEKNQRASDPPSTDTQAAPAAA